MTCPVLEKLLLPQLVHVSLPSRFPALHASSSSPPRTPPPSPHILQLRSFSTLPPPCRCLCNISHPPSATTCNGRSTPPAPGPRRLFLRQLRSYHRVHALARMWSLSTEGECGNKLLLQRLLSVMS